MCCLGEDGRNARMTAFRDSTSTALRRRPSAAGSSAVSEARTPASDIRPPNPDVQTPNSALRPPSSGLVRSGGRDPETVAFEASLVAFFVDAADMLGVPKSVAAIYGICFASPEPLSFAEIEARLDISKGSISQGLRVLREVGALRVAAGAEDGGQMTEGGKGRTDSQLSTLSSQLSGNDSQLSALSSRLSTPSSRLSTLSSQLSRGSRPRERFEPDLHLRNLVIRWLENRLQKQLESGQDRLKTIAKTVPAGKQGSAKMLKERIRTLQTWQKQAGAVLPLVKTFLKL